MFWTFPRQEAGGGNVEDCSPTPQPIACWQFAPGINRSETKVLPIYGICQGVRGIFFPVLSNSNSFRRSLSSSE